MVPLSFSTSKTRNLPISFSLLLLLASCIQEEVSAQGRSVFMHKMLSKEEEGQGMVMVSSMIGSRPPRCERRCLACGRCEAIQVPATPQERNAAAHSSMNTNVRGDDTSNYKPMNWKCKCGNFIFNP